MCAIKMISGDECSFFSFYPPLSPYSSWELSSMQLVRWGSVCTELAQLAGFCACMQTGGIAITYTPSQIFRKSETCDMFEWSLLEWVGLI